MADQHRLTDIEVEEVSSVDVPANNEPFLVVKNKVQKENDMADPLDPYMEPPMDPPMDDGAGSGAPADASGELPIHVAMVMEKFKAVAEAAKKLVAEAEAMDYDAAKKRIENMETVMWGMRSAMKVVNLTKSAAGDAEATAKAAEAEADQITDALKAAKAKVEAKKSEEASDAGEAGGAGDPAGGGEAAPGDASASDPGPGASAAGDPGPPATAAGVEMAADSAAASINHAASFVHAMGGDRQAAMRAILDVSDDAVKAAAPAPAGENQAPADTDGLAKAIADHVVKAMKAAMPVAAPPASTEPSSVEKALEAVQKELEAAKAKIARIEKRHEPPMSTGASGGHQAPSDDVWPMDMNQ